MIATLEAGPAVIVRLLDVVEVKESGVNLNVKAPAVPVTTRSVNVAMPFDAATVVVPLSVPVPDAMDATILTVEVVTVLPPESTIRITGWVLSSEPLPAPAGWVVIAAAVAAAVTANVRITSVAVS